MATERVRRGSGGTAKIGKNKNKSERYRQEHRKDKNKIRRLKAMIKNLASDNNMRIKTEMRIKELKNVNKKYI